MPEMEVEIKGTGGAKSQTPAKPSTSKEKAAGPEIKKIVRIAATDLDGTLPVRNALRKIKGVSFMFSNAICKGTGIDERKILGSLSDNELKAIEAFMTNQSKASTVPKWMINRRRDFDSGADIHLIGTNLTFRQREDINFMKRIRCRRGIRHELGLPVRGQRTKSTGRKGRGIGVVRKAAAAAPAPAKPEAKK